MKGLRDFVAVYDDVLPASLCEAMVNGFDSAMVLQHRNGAGVREGLEDSGWTEMNVTANAEPRFCRLFEDCILEHTARYNTALAMPVSISPVRRIADLMMKRYRVDMADRFQLHFDAIRAHSNRYLVYLWYLNDVAEGGETWFPELDLKIVPRAGRLLVFPPYWMFQHAGLSPKSADKYIVSTYALY